MKKVGNFIKTFFICLLAISIPGMLILDAFQARKYADLREHVLDLERTQSELVEQNKKLITDISILSSSERIEKIAEEELGMKQAESDQIVRVEMKDKKNK